MFGTASHVPDGMEIILASRSPRREELFKQVVSEFRIVPSEVDEESFRGDDPLAFALRAAEEKARDVGEKHPAALVVAADTVVNVGREILGKPKDEAEARAMLEKLSGKRHRVITACAAFKKEENRLITGYEITHVTFRPLSREAIDRYIREGDWRDKAGSYAVQEIGDEFVAKLEGNYDNVVGLPVRTVRRMVEEMRNPGVKAVITDIALPESWGVARIGKVVTFVPGAVIGDNVRLTVAKTQKRHQFGRLVAIETPSPDRVEPRCSHFGRCGGCAFQSLAYEKQLELKERYFLRVLRTLGRLDTHDVAFEPIIPSPALYFYRGKMEYAFGNDGRKIFLGLRERASPLEPYLKRTVRLSECPIFSRAVEAIFPAVLEFLSGTDWRSYDPLAGSGHLRNLVLREGKSTGEVMAVIVTKSGISLPSGRLSEVLGPLVASLWRAENDRVSDVVDYSRLELVSGREWIEEHIGGLTFKIFPRTFFQPNPQGAEILYHRIQKEALELGSRRVLGLYCGPGAIEIFLSSAVSEVVGIDSEEANIAAAEDNARFNGIVNCRFVKGPVERVLKDPGLAGFDLAILDPPRSGISRKAMKHLLALNIPGLVYVSCNPAAFARDVNLMAESGYRLRRLACFDFFPHTPHLEVLGILTRS